MKVKDETSMIEDAIKEILERELNFPEILDIEAVSSIEQKTLLIYITLPDEAILIRTKDLTAGFISDTTDNEGVTYVKPKTLEIASEAINILKMVFHGGRNDG